MRSLLQALKSIRRSPYQALAASLVLYLTFFIGYSLVLFIFGSNKVINFFETRPQVTGFFDQQTPQSLLEAHQQRLEQEPYVQAVELITQEEALEIYRAQTEQDPLLQELVTADILPSSLEVSTVTIDDLAKVAEIMQTLEGIDEVVYQQDVIDSLRQWTTNLRYVGLTVLAIFSITSLLVVVLITSMRIASKKYETKVMRLIGATKWYIMKPFLVESMLYGTVGAVLSWLTVYILMLYATPAIKSFFGEIELMPIQPSVMLFLLAGGWLAAIILGLIAGLISTRRLFRV